MTTPIGDGRPDIAALQPDLPPGLPDPAELARLATRIFRSPPGDAAARPEALTSFAPGPMPPLAVAALGMSLPAVPGPGAGDAGAQRASPFDPGALHGFSAAPSYYFTDFGQAPTPTRFADRHPGFDVHAVRRDFPILEERVHGRPLVWFDNAATTHKPQAVIDRLAHFYAHENSNIHRAAHTLAARATDAYEAGRKTVARFLNAPSADDIVFVRGATEAINLVARSWGVQHVQAGDEIVISHLEHHANIVPWQQLAQAVGAKLRVVPVDERGEFRLDEYSRLLGPRTRLVSVTHVSNALGTVTPVQEITDLAHRVGAHVLIDGAQSVSHMPVNVLAIGADFYVFSGHKVFAPTGIGALYATPEALQSMPPWQGGGNMIQDVTFERTLYQPPPAKFEAGTGNIADAAALGTALEYLERLGMANIAAYEHELLQYATACLAEVPGLAIIGQAREKAAVLSFVLDGHTPADVGQALDAEGIAVRSGHHCAQPILRRFGHEATVRASLAFYNTREEIEHLGRVLRQLATRSPAGGASHA